MIQTETIIIDEREFTRTYSDAGRYVVRDGASYVEAVDPTEYGRTYTEGEPLEDISADEALDIITGVVE